MTALWGWLVLVVGVVLASLPFVFNIRGVFRVLSFVLAYGLFVVIGRAVEGHLSQNVSQGWAFYAVTILLFCVAAFPAFAWRYLWKK